VINGSKAFITNSGTDITSLVTVTAITGDVRAAAREISRSWSRPAPPGSRVSRSTPRSAGALLDTRELFFDDVPGSASNLGRPAGPRATRSSCPSSDEGGSAIAALSVGLAQGCVDESVRYAAPSARPSATPSAPTRPSSS
jgi:alkylation response protein AidB-like acyl-CoA dehydrogenase